MAPCNAILRVASGLGILAELCVGGSQGMQDAVIRQLVDQIGDGRREYVEFGFDSTQHCSGGGGSNTCVLARDHGWSGLLLDVRNENPRINLRKAAVRSDTIAAVLTKWNVSYTVDYLSIDIDSADLWVMRAILAAGFRPRLLSLEYNSHYPWAAAITNPDPALHNTAPIPWDSHHSCFYGASARALTIAASEFDYVPVALVYANDIFFMPRELAQSKSVPEIDVSRVQLLELHMHAPLKPSQAAQLLDYAAYSSLRRNTGVIGEAELADAAHAGAASVLAALASDPGAWNHTCKHKPEFHLCKGSALYRRVAPCQSRLTAQSITHGVKKVDAARRAAWRRKEVGTVRKGKVGR